MKGLYILLSDQIASRKERGLLARQKTEEVYALQGSLWQLADPELRDVKEETLRAKPKLTLVSLEFDGVILQCSPSELFRLERKEYNLLLAVSTCLDRLKVFKDKDWLQEGLEIEKDAVVFVIKFADLPEKVPGKVRYKGPLPGHNGTWFGVELSAEYQGKGSSDGTFRKQRYFTCPLDTGIFVAINKIRICLEPSQFREWTFNTPVEHPYEVTMPPPLKINERVVWMSDNGPERGTVKWIGFLYDTRDKEWTVGVEFDNPVGTGTGKYKDRQLFRAKQNHASLVPILGLLKESELFNTGPPPGHAAVTADTMLQVELPPKVSYSERSTLRARGLGDKEASNTMKSTSSREELEHDMDPRHIGTINAPSTSDRTVPRGQSMDRGHSRDNSGSSHSYDEINGQDRVDNIYPGNHGNITVVARSGGSVVTHSCGPVVQSVVSPNEVASGGLGSSLAPDNAMHRMRKAQSFHQGGNTPQYQNLPRETVFSIGRGGSNKLTHQNNHFANLYNDSLNKRLQHGQTGYQWNANEGSELGHSDSTSDSSKRITYGEVSDGVGRGYPYGKSGLALSSSSRTSSRTDTSPGSPPPHGGNNQDMSLTSGQGRMDSLVRAQKQNDEPLPLESSEIESDLEMGSMVEVVGNPPSCKYGYIKWIGYLRDKNKPIAGLEMEEESSACTDGTFAGKRLFSCPPRKAFFVYLHKCRKDPRFAESGRFIERSDSLAFGSMDCPDIPGTVAPPVMVENVAHYCGRQRGIQGHHNSCYLDATLMSMFSFSIVFDTVLHRPKMTGDVPQYSEVQRVLHEGIVNPLRKNFYVRADKVLKLRKLMDELSNVQGLMTEEKDPEEFLNSLLQQILKAEPFLRLSNGQESFCYQLFFEKHERMVLPTTQQLLSLSFLQSDIKLAEVPSCLVLQMPRFGKNYKMYQRIVPSLYLDITDILDYGPRECYICGELAAFECKECFANFELGLDQIAFCETCLQKSHAHAKRATHMPKEIKEHPAFIEYVSQQTSLGEKNVPIRREELELFAVLCIETSHYVAFVKCGSGHDSPWLFFDSMADRMGEQHGYNIPEVKEVPEFADWLSESKRPYILSITEDKLLPNLMRRLLCDSYMLFYQSVDGLMYK